MCSYIGILAYCYLVDELEADMAGDDAVPGVVEEAVFRVADGARVPEASLAFAVDQFVATWLRDNKAWLISEWGIDADVVAEACSEYEVLGDAPEPIASAAE